MNGENEERLRMALQRESERIEVSPDLRRRLNARLGQGSSYRRRMLAASVAVVLVAAGVAVWLIGGRGPVKESLIGPPGEADTYFAGYWPVSTRADAQAMQQRVDGGEETWRREPVRVAQAYAQLALGWDLAPQVEGVPDLVGGAVEIPVAPMIGESPQKRRGPEHIVRLVSLDGAKEPVWFVAGITSPNIVVDEPRPGATITSPVRVAGTGVAFEGNILGAVVRDATNPDSHGAFSGQPIQAGSTEPMPFEATLSFPKPDVPAGIVHLKGSSGLGGPSTDVTIVRVRFAAASERSAQPTADHVTSDAAADDAFRCFFDARHYRDLEMAKPCMTKRYVDSITDPVEFIGASSPSVERATIISSAREGDRIVYDALVYWGSSQGLEFVSEDTVSVVLQRDQALVDSWTQNPTVPIDSLTTVTLRFLAPGDTPKCDGDAPTSDSFVSIQRVIPSEPVIDDLALSVVRELATGHWAHEADGAAVFPPLTRVERVSVANGVATVELNQVPVAVHSCDTALPALRQTLTGLDSITDVVLRQVEPQAPSEPDV
jgi:hypothetical protein